MQQSPPVLSFGGMCFVRKWLVDWVGEDKVGLCGPFDYIATSPAIVQHMLADDFRHFLTPKYFSVARPARYHHGQASLRHGWYEGMAAMVLNQRGLFPKWDVMSPTLKHPGTEGKEWLIDDLRRRAQHVREFFCADSWKVMVWGVA